MNKIKKGLIILFALAGAALIIYLAIPMINESRQEKIMVYTLAHDLHGDALISKDDLVAKKVTKEDIGFKVLSIEEILGNYSNSFLYAGDYITREKLQSENINFTNKMYIALKVTSEQAIAGELIKGDIISIYRYNDEFEEASLSNYLKFVKVTNVKNRLTEDIEDVKATDLGVAYKIDKTIPEYVIVEVNELQGKLLIEGTKHGDVHFAYRGNVLRDMDLMEAQENVFIELEESEKEQIE